MKRFLIYSLAFLLIVGFVFIFEGQSFKPVLFKVKDIKDVAKVDATADQYFKMDGTTGLWTPTEFMVGPAGRNLKTWWNFEDFLASHQNNTTGYWLRFIGGTAADGYEVAGTALRPGIYELYTGTTTTGYSCLASCTGDYVRSLLFGAGTYTLEEDIYIGTLSNGTDTYTIRFGFGDIANGTDFVDGAYFEYSDVGSTPNWYRCTASNSTRTKTSTGVAAVAGAWMRLKVVVNSAGTSVEYFINGISVGVVTTNIPTGTGRETGAILSILKSAGTGARNLDVDWIWLHVDLTTSR
jgi:hypothetical protein